MEDYSILNIDFNTAGVRSATRDMRAFTGAMENATKAVKRMTSATEKSMRQFEQMAKKTMTATEKSMSQFAQMAKKMNVWETAYEGLQQYMKLLKAGASYNDQLERGSISIATILAHNNEFVDSQGRLLAGQEKFNAALQVSDKILDAIGSAVARTGVSSQIFIQAFQDSIVPAQTLGATWEQTVELMVLTSKAISALNGDQEQLGKEMQRILTLHDLDNSLLVQKGVLSEDLLQKWKKGTDYVGEVANSLSMIGYAGEASEKTLSGISAQLVRIGEASAKGASQQFFEALKTGLDTLTQAFSNTTGITAIKEEFTSIIELADDLGGWFGEKLVAAINAFIGAIQSVGGFIAEYRNGINLVGGVIDTLVSNIDKAVVAFGLYKAATVGIAGATSTTFLTALGSVTSFIAATSQLRPSTMALMGLSSVLTGVSTAVGVLRGALLALATNPLAWIVGAGTALYALWDNMKQGEEESKKLAAGFDEAAAKVGLAVEKYEALAQVELEKKMGVAVEEGKKANKVLEDQADKIDALMKQAERMRDGAGGFGILSISDEKSSNSMQKVVDALSAYKKAVSEAEGDSAKLKAAADGFFTAINNTGATGAHKAFVARVIAQGKEFLTAAVNTANAEEKIAGFDGTMQGVLPAIEAATGALEKYNAVSSALASMSPLSFDDWGTAYKYLTQQLSGTETFKKLREELAKQNMAAAMAEAQASVTQMELDAERLSATAHAIFLAEGATEKHKAADTAAREAAQSWLAAIEKLPTIQAAYKDFMNDNSLGRAAGQAAKKVEDEIERLEKSIEGLKGKLGEALSPDEQRTKIWESYSTAEEKVLNIKNEKQRLLALEEAQLERNVALAKVDADEHQTAAQNVHDVADFYAKLADLSGDYGVSIEYQNKLIDEQIDNWRNVHNIHEDDLATMEKLMKLQVSQDFDDGVTRAFIKYKKEATDLGKQAESAFSGLLNGIDNSFQSMWQGIFEKGKLSLSSLKGVFSNFLGEMAHMALTRPIMLNIAGSISSLFGGSTTANAAQGGLGSAVSGQGGLGSMLGSLSLGSLVPDSVKNAVAGWFGGGSSSMATTLANSGWSYSSGGMASLGVGSSYSAGLGATGAYVSPYGGSSVLGVGNAATGGAYISPYGGSSVLGVGGPPATTPAAATSALAPYVPYIGAAIAALPSLIQKDYGSAAVNGSAALAGLYVGGKIGSSLGPWGTLVGIGVGATVGAVGNDIKDGNFKAESIGIPTKYTHSWMSMFGEDMAKTLEKSSQLNAQNVAAMALGGDALNLAMNHFFGGKERELLVYSAMRTNLVDPGAYTADLTQVENKHAMADAFGDTKRDLRKGWNAIDLKGTTGHSAYYIDPVHGGKQSKKIAQDLDPVMAEMEEMVLGISNTLRDSLPTDTLKKALDAYNSENALELEYKIKGKKINEKGMTKWAEAWAEDTQNHLLNALNSIDWSEYDGTINVDTSTWEGYERFLGAVTLIKDVEDATKELTEPTSQWVTQAREAVAQLEAWQYELRKYDVEAEYAAELIDAYTQASIDNYITAMEDAVSPVSQLSQALKELGDDMDGRIEGLKILGATEEDLTRVEKLRAEAMRQLEYDMKSSFYDKLRLDALSLMGGDSGKEQLLQQQKGDRASAAATFGDESAEYAALLAVQNAQRLAHEYDALVNGMSELTNNVNDAANAVSQAEAAYEEACNAIKSAIDAWVDGAQSAFDTAADALVSAMESSVAAYESLADSMRAARVNLWMGDTAPDPAGTYASAKSEMDRLYAAYQAGDTSVASDLTGAVNSFLSASHGSQTDYGDYQRDFYDAQGLLAKIEADARAQADSVSAELEALYEQLGIEKKIEKSLEQLKDETISARASLDKALEEQQAAYARWGFEAIVPGMESLEAAYWASVAKAEAAQSAMSVAQQTSNEYLADQNIYLDRIAKAEEAALKAMGQAQQAVDKADEQAKAGYGIYGSKHGTETELLTAKANAMNDAGWSADSVARAISANGLTVEEWYKKYGIEEGFATGKGVYGSAYATEAALLAAKAAKMDDMNYWNVGLIRAAIAADGLTVEDWYKKYGKLEGFARGGVATSGLALVGEEGPELVDFSSRAMVYPAEETTRILSGIGRYGMADAQSDGSPRADAALIGELREQNNLLRAILRENHGTNKNTRACGDILDFLAGDGTAESHDSDSAVPALKTFGAAVQ